MTTCENCIFLQKMRLNYVNVSPNYFLSTLQLSIFSRSDFRSGNCIHHFPLSHLNFRTFSNSVWTAKLWKKTLTDNSLSIIYIQRQSARLSLITFRER